MKHKHLQLLWLGTMVFMAASGIYTDERWLVEFALAGAAGFVLGWWRNNA